MFAYASPSPSGGPVHTRDALLLRVFLEFAPFLEWLLVSLPDSTENPFHCPWQDGRGSHRARLARRETTPSHGRMQWAPSTVRSSEVLDPAHRWSGPRLRMFPPPHRMLRDPEFPNLSSLWLKPVYPTRPGLSPPTRMRTARSIVSHSADPGQRVCSETHVRGSSLQT